MARTPAAPSASSRRGVHSRIGAVVEGERDPARRRGPRQAQAGVSRCGSHAQPTQAAAPSAATRPITSAPGGCARTASTIRRRGVGAAHATDAVAQVLEEGRLAQRALELARQLAARAGRQRDAGAGGEALVALLLAGQRAVEHHRQLGGHGLGQRHAAGLGDQHVGGGHQRADVVGVAEHADGGAGGQAVQARRPARRRARRRRWPARGRAGGRACARRRAAAPRRRGSRP